MLKLFCIFVLTSFFLSSSLHALETDNEEHFKFVNKCAVDYFEGKFKTYKRKDSRYPEGEELACAIANYVGEHNDPMQEDRAALKRKGLICTSNTYKDTTSFRPQNKFPFDTAPEITFLYFSDNGLLHYNKYAIFISDGDDTKKRAKFFEGKGGGGFFPFEVNLERIEFRLWMYYSDGRNPINYERITDIFELESKTPKFSRRDRPLLTSRGWVFKKASKLIYLNRENLILDWGGAIQCELLPESDFEQANKLFLQKQKEIKDEFVPRATALIEEVFEFHENKRKEKKAKQKL